MKCQRSRKSHTFRQPVRQQSDKKRSNETKTMQPEDAHKPIQRKGGRVLVQQQRAVEEDVNKMNKRKIQLRTRLAIWLW